MVAFGVLLRTGARVCCSDGGAGWLRDVHWDPQARAPHWLVVEMVDAGRREVMVPAERMLACGYDTIFLDLTRAELAAVLANLLDRLPGGG